MRFIDPVLISEEVWDARFSCDYAKCRGACCQNGDLGAPVTEEEVQKIEGLLPRLAPYLSEKSQKFLRKGISEVYQKKLHLREIEANHPCPLGFVDTHGWLKCSIHQWALDTDEKPELWKPLWCSLYPLVVLYKGNSWTMNLFLTPACRSDPKAPPVLLSFLPLLQGIFGPDWAQKIREEFSERN